MDKWPIICYSPGKDQDPFLLSCIGYDLSKYLLKAITSTKISTRAFCSLEITQCSVPIPYEVEFSLTFSIKKSLFVLIVFFIWATVGLIFSSFLFDEVCDKT